jgi:hypothetical protein
MSHTEGVHLVRIFCKTGLQEESRHLTSLEQAEVVASKMTPHCGECTIEIHLETRNYERNKLTRVTTWKKVA